MKKRLLTLLVSLMLVMVSGSVVSACGGFFCTNSPIDQSAERIIFTVNPNNTITAYIGIEYEGAAEDFSWLLPVPSVPEVDVAEEASLDAIQIATNRTFTSPTNYCPLVPPEGGGGGGGGPIFGNTGPYDYIVLTEDDPEVVVAWLRNFGYRITDEMIPLIEYYVVVEDMDILAMRLSQGFEAGDIKPVKLTYQGQHPMIPIILTSVAATSNMPILTWIFGDTQYVPTNWAHVTPDYAAFRAPSQLRGFTFSFNPFNTYSRELSNIQAEHGGLAFVTEYAQPTSVLREVSGVTDDALLNELTTNYAYVTRLRAQLSPDQMTVDPTFVPDESAPPVLNRVNLAEYVDPLHFWGCSSRSLVSTNNIDTSNLDFQRIDTLSDTLNHAYPAGWVLSEILAASYLKLYVFAEESVTTEDVIATLEGTDITPMVIYAAGERYSYAPQFFQSTFGIENSLNEQAAGQRILFSSRWNLYYWNNDHIFIITTDADYEENTASYDALLRLFDGFQYFVTPELQHTLFLGDYDKQYQRDGSYTSVFVSYPDGWIEYIDDDGIATIVPDGFNPNDTDAPFVRIHLLNNLNSNVYQVSVESIASLMNAYELDNDVREAFHTAFFPQPESTYYCSYSPPEAIMFTKDGRQGYITAVSQYYIEASANIADFETYAAVLQQMANTLIDPLSSCG